MNISLGLIAGTRSKPEAITTLCSGTKQMNCPLNIDSNVSYVRNRTAAQTPLYIPHLTTECF